MEFPFSNGAGGDGRPAARLARSGAGPLLLLVIAGLFAEAARPDEAYAGIDYGLSLLALLGATGCVVSLAGRISSGLHPLPWMVPTRVPRPAASIPGVRLRGEDWPLLVSLLFGALVVLISGLGGWV